MVKKEDNKIPETPNILRGVETGVVALDLVLGGSLPLGKMIELNGESASGKSTLALYVASRLCKQGKKVYYIDIERGVDQGIMRNMELLEHLGKNFVLDQTTSLYSDFQKVIDGLIGLDRKKLGKPKRHEDTPDLIILDSLAMMVADDSKEKTIESNVANNMITSRYATQTFKDMVGDLAEVGTTLLFINHTQIKMQKIGFSMTRAYEDSAGSSMVKYGPDIRLYIDKTRPIKAKRKTIVGEQESRVGVWAEIRTKKSRVEDNEIRLPLKLIDAFGIFNGYTLKAICENIGWITGGSGGHYHIQNPIIPKEIPEGATVNEKGYYIQGSDNVEIFCQKNAGFIVTQLKKNGLYRLTLDRNEHKSMLDVVTKVELCK